MRRICVVDYENDGHTSAFPVPDGVALKDFYFPSAGRLLVRVAFVEDVNTGSGRRTWEIDRAFVTDILTNAGSAMIVRTVVDLAHSLGQSVVAEGAETAGDAEALARAGCEYGQGFHFGQPLAAHEVGPYLAAAHGAGRVIPLAPRAAGTR